MSCCTDFSQICLASLDKYFCEGANVLAEISHEYSHHLAFVASLCIELCIELYITCITFFQLSNFLLVTPFDVIKVRLQAQARSASASTGMAIK